MGWLRLVGSLKLYVSFAKEPYERDYILQKRPIIVRSLLIVATPYLHTLTSTLALELQLLNRILHTLSGTLSHTPTCLFIHTLTRTCLLYQPHAPKHLHTLSNALLHAPAYSLKHTLTCIYIFFPLHSHSHLYTLPNTFSLKL